MKFLNLIEQRLKTLSEQVPGEVAAPVPMDPAAAVAPAPVPAPVPASAPAPTPEETQKALTPEGEVFLVRLLKKALFMNPGDIDEKALSELPEINEKNAAEVLNNIVGIMRKYSTELDVETT